MIDPTTDSDRKRYWTHSAKGVDVACSYGIHPAEVEAIAEARAAAVLDLYPDRATPIVLGTPVVTIQTVNVLVAMVNRQADELDYLRRRVERLEQGKVV